MASFRPVGASSPKFGTMLGEPAALGLRQRCSAESVFTRETTAVELGFEISQRPRLFLIAGTIRETAAQAHDESEAVLEVVHLGFSHDPGPIQSPVPQDEPG